MGIRIITDSTSDISRDEASKLNIDIVPLKVNIDGNCYTEGIDLSNEEFYKNLKQQISYLLQVHLLQMTSLHTLKKQRWQEIM